MSANIKIIERKQRDPALFDHVRLDPSQLLSFIEIEEERLGRSCTQMERDQIELLALEKMGVDIVNSPLQLFSLKIATILLQAVDFVIRGGQAKMIGSKGGIFIVLFFLAAVWLKPLWQGVGL